LPGELQIRALSVTDCKSVTSKQTLRLRFQLNKDALMQISKNLQKLDLTTLEQLSETAILANQMADFEVKLQEILIKS